MEEEDKAAAGGNAGDEVGVTVCEMHTLSRVEEQEGVRWQTRSLLGVGEEVAGLVIGEEGQWWRTTGVHKISHTEGGRSVRAHVRGRRQLGRGEEVAEAWGSERQ
ncbi:hypothetical protein Salat_2421000 [Sesamum alatum]|uniref:Uncharacterized protein n=1 Tax=Sesamum alatum TaxID=300844 RepID=A0AAE2CFC1_9LAMI|nr:hypothetical protein Salat_2421000 [Sesamum alatum]